MRTKELYTEKALRVKSAEMDNEKLKDEINNLESKIYKKEEHMRVQERDIVQLQRDIETLRDSFNGSSKSKGTSSYNDMDSMI